MQVIFLCYARCRTLVTDKRGTVTESFCVLPLFQIQYFLRRTKHINCTWSGIVFLVLTFQKSNNLRYWVARAFLPIPTLNKCLVFRRSDVYGRVWPKARALKRTAPNQSATLFGCRGFYLRFSSGHTLLTCWVAWSFSNTRWTTGTVSLRFSECFVFEKFATMRRDSVESCTAVIWFVNLRLKIIFFVLLKHPRRIPHFLDSTPRLDVVKSYPAPRL